MEKILFKTEIVEKTLPVVLIELGGYIDQSNCDKLQKLFDTLILNNYYCSIFDLRTVAYMSSAGWGIFVGEVKRFRDNGGDIKLINMNSEIYEVFQMLEFYHILEDYESLNEALEAFGVSIESEEKANKDIDIQDILDKVKPPEEKEEASTTFFEKGNEFFDDSKSIQNRVINKPEKETKISEEKKYHKSIKPQPRKSPSIDLTQIPVQEKVRNIISHFPLISIRRMKKILKEEEYGFEKIGYLKLYKMLKNLDLDTKSKRYRYYRSC